jgi:hypothetical protein
MFASDDGLFEICVAKSITAYGLASHNDFLLPGFELVKGRKIWFGYGEIDCRFQIFNQHVKNGTPLDIEIDKVVFKYLDYVTSFIGQGYDISIVSVVPAQREPFHGIDPRSNDPGNGGTHIQRRYITEMVNSKLRLECFRRGIPYIDIYHYLVDPLDGFNREDMVTDGMHYGYIGHILQEAGLI